MIPGEARNRSLEIQTNFYKKYIPFIYDINEQIYIQQDIDFDALQHLDSIGLINFSSLPNIVLKDLPKHITIKYHEEPLYLEFAKESNNELQVGHVILSRIGEQLAPICGSKPVDGFPEYIIERLFRGGRIISPSPPPK